MPPWTPRHEQDEHPDHSIGEWICEVRDGTTRESYIDWVRTQIELHEEATA